MLITKQLRNLFPTFQNRFDVVAVIKFPTECLLAGMPIDLFAQDTIVRMCEHRIDIRRGKTENITIQSFVGSLSSRNGQRTFGDASQTRRALFEVHKPSVSSLQRPLPEIELSVGQLHTQLAVTPLVLFGKVCSSRHKRIVGFV